MKLFITGLTLEINEVQQRIFYLTLGRSAICFALGSFQERVCSDCSNYAVKTIQSLPCND